MTTHTSPELIPRTTTPLTHPQSTPRTSECPRRRLAPTSGDARGHPTLMGGLGYLPLLQEGVTPRKGRSYRRHPQLVGPRHSLQQSLFRHT
uniref:Uncharacterized protein n=1 Tax=Steinernema glaseri TaxID=37863 RepID=A0A1I7YN24_9BILA